MPKTLVLAVSRISPTRALTALVLTLLVSYVALIAFVMSYGAVETEMAQAVRDASAQVSTLESQSLAGSTAFGALNPRALGYTTPVDKAFVTGTAKAALLVPGE
jgi:hypothetical protein